MIHYRRSYWIYFDPKGMRAHIFPSMREHETPNLEFLGEYQVGYGSELFRTTEFIKWVKQRLQLLGIEFSREHMALQEHPC